MKQFISFFILVFSITYGNAQLTYVPDDNFENYLETHTMTGQVVPIGHPNSMGNGVANDDYVFTSRIELDTHLFIQNLGISDLTGIEDFTALTNLACHDNNLTQLDFSSNLNLSELYCFRNQLTSLNVSSNSMLTRLVCAENQLSNIDVTNNPQLIELSCGLNQISNLDVTQNTVLQALSCYSNLLTNIDVSQNLSLINLFCGDNQLTTVNTIVNTNLNRLGINENPITTYDVTHLPNLTLLYIFGTQIATIDLSQNVSLSILNCDDNSFLTSLNVKNGNNTNITTFTTLNTPSLVCVEVDDATYSNTNWTNIDSVNSFSENCHYNETYVPDDNFENYLETHDANGNVVAVGDANSMGNGIANDDYVFTSAINTVTNLNVSNKNISDLTGIEDFLSLEFLNCYTNQISSLNVSNNINLKTLWCGYNNLTSINTSTLALLEDFRANNNLITAFDVSNNSLLNYFISGNNPINSLDVTNNPNLINLQCMFNNLNVLDLSNNTSLEVVAFNSNNLTLIDLSSLVNLKYLDCNGNNLTNLNLSNNLLLEELTAYTNSIATIDLSLHTNLVQVYVENNQLSSLNVKNTNNLNITDFYFRATNNPNLTCIEVDDAAWSTANWIHIDAQTSFNTNCANPETYTPDDNFENYLETHDANGNVVAVGDASSMGNGIANDDYVTTSAINSVSNLNIDSQNISDLTGIEDFSALDTLICSNNQLSGIDISQNIALTFLHCNNNQLTSLDISQNVLLTYLSCTNSQLTSLDVTQNTVLETLICYSNQITSLDVSLNSLLSFLNCHTNQLTALNAKNGNNINFTVFDATTNPSLTCIEVDDAAWSTANWTNIEATSTFVNNQTECSTLSNLEYNLVDYSAYPNPVKDQFTVYIQNNATYTLLSVNGKVLKQGRFIYGENTIDMSSLSNGLYFLQVESSKGISTKKIIKQ